MPDIGESIGRRSRADDDSFRPSLNYIAINKGVKTFAFSSRGNTLVTGGIDRIVRIYNIPSRTFQITKGQDYSDSSFLVFSGHFGHFDIFIFMTEYGILESKWIFEGPQ